MSITRTVLASLAVLLFPHPVPFRQDATFCSSLKRIAEASPDKWKSYTKKNADFFVGKSGLVPVKPKDE